MYDELTEVDLKKMQEEIDYRVKVVRPKVIDDVKVAREFGDLSENFEYKAAKREKNKNESRIRYLERMIKTARVISAGGSADGAVGLFDRVELYFPEDKLTEKYQIVTTLRQDAAKGFLSKESPLAKAVLGRRVGDVVTVTVSEEYSYLVEIKSVEKGEDNDTLPIREY